MEQRTSFRISFEESVQYGYLGKPYYDGVLSNISDSGLAIKVDNPIPENTSITIIIYYQSKPIEIEGKVIRVSQDYYSSKFEMGVYITSRNIEYKSIYESMMRRYY